MSSDDKQILTLTTEDTGLYRNAQHFDVINIQNSCKIELFRA